MQATLTSTFIPHQSVASHCATHHLSSIDYALSLLDSVKRYAVVPVSQFQVAAIAIDAPGNFYIGVNQEYAPAAMAHTVHAEQSAISHAWSRGASRIAHVVVNYPPCGHCRQFINECRGSERVHIHLPTRQHIPLRELLPQDFSPADLGMSARLLDTQRTPLSASEVSDALSQAAISAAERSYAPYSGAHAGVALQLDNGEILSAPYAENAAYNPALPPLQAALNLVHLRGLCVDNVTAATLARIAGHGHAAHAQALWTRISKAPLHLIAVEHTS